LAAAELAFVRAAPLKPDDADTLSDLGLVRMARGDVTGAEEALTRSIQIKPDSAEAMPGGGTLAARLT
jgi:Flp pilus assembly protein TadD